MESPFTKTLTILLIGFAPVTNTARAQFTITNRDVLVVFRSSSQADVEFNVGSADMFKALAPGTTITLDPAGAPTLAGSLGSLYGVNNFGNITMVAVGYQPVGVSTPVAQRTLYLSSPRANVNDTPNIFAPGSSSAQNNWLTVISGVETAAKNWGAGSPSNPTNLVDLAIIPSGNPPGLSYTFKALTGGSPTAADNLAGQFSADLGNKTPASFGTTAFIRSDLIEMVPNAGSGTVIGWFDFYGDGHLTFTTPALQQPDYPPLNITKDAGMNFFVSWITTEPGLILQQATVLGTPTVWSDTTEMVTTNGLTQLVQQAIANEVTQRFYRLRRP